MTNETFKTPKWSDLADEQRLHLLDTLSDVRMLERDEDAEYYLGRLMRRLRLTKSERVHARQLILARQVRRSEETTALMSLRLAIHERFMAGSAGTKKLDAVEYAGQAHWRSG